MKKKQTYNNPATEITWFNSQCSMLASTNIPIGGSGGFDTKRDNAWDDIWDDEEEEEEEEYFS